MMLDHQKVAGIQKDRNHEKHENLQKRVSNGDVFREVYGNFLDVVNHGHPKRTLIGNVKEM